MHIGNYQSSFILYLEKKGIGFCFFIMHKMIFPSYCMLHKNEFKHNLFYAYFFMSNKGLKPSSSSSARN